MINNETALLDLLLGVIHAQGQVPAGVSDDAGAVSFDAIFGDILENQARVDLPPTPGLLDRFLPPNPIPRESGQGNRALPQIPAHSEIPNDLTARSTTPHPSPFEIVGKPIDAETITGDHNSHVLFGNIVADGQPADVAHGTKIEPWASLPPSSYAGANVAVFDHNTPFSFSSLSTSEGPGMLPSDELWTLKPGAYHVVRSSVEQGALHLEVAASDQPQKTIRISLPVSDLQVRIGSDRQDSLGNRLQEKDPLAAIKQNLIDDYIAKLNITEIRVETSPPIRQPTAADSHPAKHMGIEIVAQNVGQEMVLKCKLQSDLPRYANHEIPAEADDGEAFRSLLPEATRSPQAIGREQIMPCQEPLPRMAVDMLRGNLPGQDRTAIHWLNSSQDNGKGNADTVLNDRTSAENALGVVRDTNHVNLESMLDRPKVVPQPIRFTLPDDMRTSLRPGGQSVRLHIEPEHLGTARLNLMMHNDHLRAVVTVKSIQAQSAVEQSLDKLIDALHKADIEVDYIDVNVDSRQAGQQSPGRRFPSFRFQNMAGRFSLTEVMPQTDLYSGAGPVPATSYVGSQGVNILA